jgi:catechol 2,3-dioxygenase-like lactoylglutathione lyase family enzyme
MIEHVSLPVSDIGEAKEFYAKALAPLGYELKHDWGEAAGFMEGGHTSFIVGETKKVVPTHIAFRAGKREAVNDFYQAALGAGGKDNGAPGYRKDYSPGYYAAFVHDADGNNVEAVWYDPELEPA